MGEKGTPKLAPAKAFLLDKFTVLVVSMVSDSGDANVCAGRGGTQFCCFCCRDKKVLFLGLRMPYPQLCAGSFTKGSWKNWGGWGLGWVGSRGGG